MWQTNQQNPPIECAWVDLIHTVTKLWLHFDEMFCLGMCSMQKECDSFQREPDQVWQEVQRRSTEEQPSQEGKATRNCFARATVPVALRGVTGQGSKGLRLPCAYEGLSRLLSCLRMPPCNEKNQSNVVKCWASSRALSALPQTALQLELLHAHLKDISGSAAFPGVSVGAGNRCLAGSNPLSCLVHMLLIHNFHWYRLGMLVANKTINICAARIWHPVFVMPPSSLYLENTRVVMGIKLW